MSRIQFQRTLGPPQEPDAAFRPVRTDEEIRGVARFRRMVWKRYGRKSLVWLIVAAAGFYLVGAAIIGSDLTAFWNRYLSAWSP